MGLHRLKRFLMLSNGDRCLLLRALVSLATVDLRLRVLGFRHVVERAGLSPPERDPTPEELRQALRYTRWLDTASRHHFVRARCLQKSVVLNDWLRREGLPSELRIGVRKMDGRLQAHAWVELGGRVVSDRPSAVASFKPLGASGRAHFAESAEASGRTQPRKLVTWAEES